MRGADDPRGRGDRPGGDDPRGRSGDLPPGQRDDPRVRGDRPGGRDRPRPAVLPAATSRGHAVIARRTLLTGAVLAAVGAIAARPRHRPRRHCPSPPVPGRRFRGRRSPHADHLRPALVDDRRQPHVHLVRRIPPVPAAEPVALVRRAAEDEGERLQRRLDVLQLELPFRRRQASTTSPACSRHGHGPGHGR